LPVRRMRARFSRNSGKNPAKNRLGEPRSLDLSVEKWEHWNLQV